MKTIFNRFIVVVALLSVMIAGCEKEVKINLRSAEPKMVVQGVIENGAPPYVILNTTLGFFSRIDLTTVQNSFIHDAVVKVSDGIKTITLKEYAFDTSANNKFYVYSVDTSSPANLMIGELGKYYTLIISYNGTTYTSVTKIPYPKGLDTLWFGEPVFKRSSTPANAQELFGNYTDPDTPGNYVKYFTSRNGEMFNPGSVFTDEIVNGKPINNIDLFAGTSNDNNGDFSDSLLYFYPGDSVVLKWAEIDKGVYDFWNTYEFSIRSGGNPFSSPINIKSNISNGAKGCWAGYGAILYHMKAK